MYLVRKLSGNNILNHFTFVPAGQLVGRISGTIVPNVPKERLVRLYLNIYQQNVPTVQNKGKCILMPDTEQCLANLIHDFIN